jgi:hypothetical protein
VRLAMKISKRIRDLVIEVVAATVVVAGIVAYGFSLPPGTTIDGRPVALVGNTLVVFGFVIYWFRGAWKKLAFWAITLALLACHCIVYVFVVSRIQPFPTLYFVPLDMVELALILMLTPRLTGVRPRN